MVCVRVNKKEDRKKAERQPNRLTEFEKVRQKIEEPKSTTRTWASMLSQLLLTNEI